MVLYPNKLPESERVCSGICSKSMPSIFIDESRSKQMKNKEILNTNIQRGKELIESVTNPEVKKGMKEALSQLQSSLEKVQRQEKGLKKGFF